jgi:hypothetical protein
MPSLQFIMDARVRPAHDVELVANGAREIRSRFQHLSVPENSPFSELATGP